MLVRWNLIINKNKYGDVKQMEYNVYIDESR